MMPVENSGRATNRLHTMTSRATARIMGQRLRRLVPGADSSKVSRNMDAYLAWGIGHRRRTCKFPGPGKIRTAASQGGRVKRRNNYGFFGVPVGVVVGRGGLGRGGLVVAPAGLGAGAAT